MMDIYEYEVPEPNEEGDYDYPEDDDMATERVQI